MNLDHLRISSQNALLSLMNVYSRDEGKQWNTNSLEYNYNSLEVHFLGLELRYTGLEAVG